MKEVGLNYLVGCLPEHSILFLVTSDGGVEWRDMLNVPVGLDHKLSDEMIEGRKKDGTPITTKDIVAFSQKPSSEGLSFDLREDIRKERLGRARENQKQCVSVFEPEYGQEIQILNNTGATLLKLGSIKEAAEAYQQAIALNPKDAYPYNGLGYALVMLNRAEEAIEVYQQAVAVDPTYAYPYNGLGDALLGLSRTKEAIEAYQQAIVIDPTYAYPYNGLADAFIRLGRLGESIKARQTFFLLSRKEKKDVSSIK
jgi:tetratricopeptide (TPR) repeat protein